mgnify:CR=1 FL=1
MNGFDNADDSRRHFGGDGHGSALGDLVVELIVQLGGAHVKGIAVEAFTLHVLVQRLPAVDGVASLILQAKDCKSVWKENQSAVG